MIGRHQFIKSANEGSVLVISPKDRAVRGRACLNPKELQSHFLRGGSLRSRKAATLPEN